MAKIQVNSQNKVYATSEGKVLLGNVGSGSYIAGDGIIIENDEISVDGITTNSLNIDTIPVQSSSNLITSGGVYSVLGDIESTINTIRGV